MHTNHRVAPVPDRIHRHLELLRSDTPSPGREVGRRPHRDLDADLGQRGFEVLLDGLELARPRDGVDLQRQPDAIGAGFEACGV